jgi:hypothetical protein
MASAIISARLVAIKKSPLRKSLKKQKKTIKETAANAEA